MSRRLSIAWCIIMMTVIISASKVHAGIATTKHNLSTSGPGPIKATTEQRVCVFCHTPHRAIADVAGIGVPLWNHTLSVASYQLFSSATLLSPTSPVIQPDGSSRLCLSCHDGTVALGSVVNTGNTLSSLTLINTAPGGVMPEGVNNVGTDLSGDHPISIELNSALINDKAQQCDSGLVSFKVCSPPVGSPVHLERTNNRYGAGAATGVGVQCGSCHDPHEDPIPGVTVFLRAGDRINHDELCNACHIADCAAACP